MVSRAPAPPTVATLSSISASFPQLPTPLVDRPHIIGAIDTMLEGQIQAVVLEGEEGIGKTILGAQFVEWHPNRAFCLFAAGPSALARSPEFLFSDLCDQVAFLLTGKRFSPGEKSRVFLRKGLIELARSAVSRGEPYFIVVDGLLERLDDDISHVTTTLTQLLPLGVRGFKFLITGSLDRLSTEIQNSLTIKTYRPAGFGLHEAREYLGEFSPDPKALNEIYRLCRGIPGKLASVRRLLQQGADLRDVAGPNPTTFAKLFELEWKAVDSCDPAELQALAFLSHARHNLSLKQLERLCGLHAEGASSLTARLRFLSLDEASGVLTFVSASFKNFAASRLDSYRSSCIDRMIEILLGDGISVDAVEHLPGYLQAVGRSNEVISYLTPDHLASVCERLRSLTPVRSAIQRGARVAADLALPVDALRFSLQHALVAELEVASVLASEVDARLKVEGTGSALSLANTAFLKEDRLQLLSRIARHQKKAGEYTDPALLEEIRQLASSADFTTWPARAIEIAEDLICCLPDVAMALVERAATGESGRGLDLALARLSILAADAENLGEKTGASRDAIVERIRSTGVRQLARAASLQAGKYGVEDLLRRCGTMTSAEDALFLLEHWCLESRRNVDAWKATEYGLNLILKAATYTPSARVVRRLCAPLPFCAPDHPYETNTLLQQVDAQADTLRARGPAVEFVRLQLSLAETESAWDLKQADSRMEELYFYVESLTGPTRIESLARCVEALIQGETGRLHDACKSLLQLFESELRQSVPSLLSSTAQHAEVLDGVIAAMASASPTFVNDVIKSVNTTERRDKLRQRFAICRFHPKRPLPPASELVKLLGEFESVKCRETCLAELLDWLFFHDSVVLTSDWEEVLRRCLSIAQAPIRHETVAKAYVLARRCPELQGTSVTAQLKTECRRSLGRVDNTWTHIDYGFTTAGVLSDVDGEEAEAIYQDTLEIRRVANLSSRPAAIAYIGCVKLAIRAFIGLIRHKLPAQDDLTRLRELISKVPSAGERARLLSELAVRCFSANADDIGRAVTQNDLIPAIKAITDDGFKPFVLVQAAPALFRLHRQIAFDELDKISVETRDEALSEICSFIFTGLHHDDPSDSSRDTVFDIGYPAATDILDCLDRMSRDCVLFTVISRLASSVVRDDSLLTRDQRAEIARRLKSAVSSKLPSATGVAHEGYLVAVDAHIARLSNSGRTEWELLAARAQRIPNVCDRVLVLALVAEAAPSRHQDLRVDLLNKAKDLADSIPWDLDRMNRLFNIASIAMDIDSTTAKTCMRKAFTLSREVQHESIEERQRAMVDVAYRLDPAFAKSLVALVDNDPARARARERLQRQIDVKEARRELANQSDIEVRLRQLTHRGVADLCWSLLGGLNSGRVATVKATTTIPYVQMAGFRSLSDMYPVLAWVIENSVQRHDDTPYGVTHLVDLFTTTTFACDLSMRLIIRASGLQQELSSLRRPLTDSGEGLVVHAGEREKMTAFLRGWLTTHRPEYLKICDPYFTLADLDLLTLIQESAPACRIQLLISEKKQKEAGVAEPFEDAYRKYWRLHVSDQDPPDTDITIVSVTGTGDSPIHDRWIVGNGRGLRLGSSFSGLGRNKLSEVSVLERSVAVDREREIDQYLTRQLREVLGKRIKYGVFSLV